MKDYEDVYDRMFESGEVDFQEIAMDSGCCMECEETVAEYGHYVCPYDESEVHKYCPYYERVKGVLAEMIEEREE